MLQPGAVLKDIIQIFLAKLIGKMSNWFNNLNVYAKDQLIEAKSVDELLVLLYFEFFGKWEDDLIIARKEFY